MNNNFGHSWRAYLIYIFLAISLFILVFRMVSLKYVEGDFLTSKGKSMLETSRSIPAIRGSILDRNNFPLAVSINQYDLYALKKFSEEEKLFVGLCHVRSDFKKSSTSFCEEKIGAFPTYSASRCNAVKGIRGPTSFMINRVIGE